MNYAGIDPQNPELFNYTVDRLNVTSESPRMEVFDRLVKNSHKLDRARELCDAAESDLTREESVEAAIDDLRAQTDDLDRKIVQGLNCIRTTPNFQEMADRYRNIKTQRRQVAAAEESARYTRAAYYSSTINSFATSNKQ